MIIAQKHVRHKRKAYQAVTHFVQVRERAVLGPFRSMSLSDKDAPTLNRSARRLLGKMRAVRAR
jgi:hypothetical protein